MRVLVIEPYFGGSHRHFVEVLRRLSCHTISALTLPARFWKWRLSGSPLVLAEEFRRLPETPDFLLFMNTIDVATFLALAGPRAATLPRVVFFHENQITYPRSPFDTPDVHYGLINITSMLAADEVWFNSDYQRRELFAAIPPFLHQFPDHLPEGIRESLAARSHVLGIPVDPLPETAPAQPKGAALRILWNHRWEYDKGPELFFAALEQLQAQGVPFEVVLLGEGFRQVPPLFERARETLGPRLLRYGYCESRQDYAAWVRACDVIVSCAQHEFFGISVAEAVMAGLSPILPNRLVYPDFIPPSEQTHHLYEEQDDLVRLLRFAARDLDTLRRRPPLPFYDAFRAPAIVATLDERLRRLAASA